MQYGTTALEGLTVGMTTAYENASGLVPTTSTSGTGSYVPPGSVSGTIFDGGYWSNGFWYPYVPQPQPYIVPLTFQAPLVLPELPQQQKLALETLKLGTKVPKALRDKALAVIAEGLKACG